MSAFTDAMAWHQNGAHVSGVARSVKMTQAIVNELMEGRALLRELAAGDPTDTVTNESFQDWSRRATQFLERTSVLDGQT